MTDIQHNADCIKWQKHWEEEVRQFKANHPNHCQTCGGWGFYRVPGCYVPYGSTSVPLPDDWEPCPKCVAEGLCPWCGKELSTKVVEELGDAYFCSHCGWAEGTQDGGLPEQPYCFCRDVTYNFAC